jgi:hypothetical protein
MTAAGKGSVERRTQVYGREEPKQIGKRGIRIRALKSTPLTLMLGACMIFGVCGRLGRTRAGVILSDIGADLCAGTLAEKFALSGQ